MNDYLKNCAIIFVENTVDFSIDRTKQNSLLSLYESLPCKKYWALKLSPESETLNDRNVAFYSELSEIDTALNAILALAKQDENKKFLMVCISSLNISVSLILEGLLNLKVLDVSVGPTKEGGVYLIGFKEDNYTFLLNKDWTSELLYKSILRDLGEEKLAMYRLSYLPEITLSNSDQSLKKT
jgi:hypothetical protein